MKNEKVISRRLPKEEIKKRNNPNIVKKIEIAPKINIQKNNNKNQKLSDKKKNKLIHYHEIAKRNTHNLMNNPTIKDVIRITDNESIFDQLKAKEESNDLSDFLETFPLKRVERINYKCLEIGEMRRSLRNLKTKNANFNKEKGKNFARNLFEKRKRQRSVNQFPVLTMENLSSYNLHNQQDRKNYQSFKNKKLFINNLASSNIESWLKKYRNKKEPKNSIINKTNVNPSSTRIEVKFFKNTSNDKLKNEKNKEIKIKNIIMTKLTNTNDKKYSIKDNNNINKNHNIISITDYNISKNNKNTIKKLANNNSNKNNFSNKNKIDINKVKNKNNYILLDKNKFNRQNNLSIDNLFSDNYTPYNRKRNINLTEVNLSLPLNNGLRGINTRRK